jgi:hypothetical protein
LSFSPLQSCRSKQKPRWGFLDFIRSEIELRAYAADVGSGDVGVADDSQSLAKFRGEVRLVPLPGMVFFPHVIQGLHIFAPRYRQMTSDAIDDDGFITLVQIPQTPEQEYPQNADKLPACGQLRELS